jgi:hypothetical protein
MQATSFRQVSERLKHEVRELQAQAEALNSPSTFAACAKLQRQAIVKEKELKVLSEAQAQAQAKRSVLDWAQPLVKVPSLLAVAFRGT